MDLHAKIIFRKGEIIMDSLFTSKNIKDLEIKNRIVVPPMVCFNFPVNNGFVSENNIEHYEKMAKGGSGLIIVEATCVSENGRLSKDQLGIWSDEHISGLKRIVEVCHKHERKVFIQLHHTGLRTPRGINEDTITSSDYNDEKVSARAMTKDEIHSIQEDFVNAAIRAEKAGFDGIELHGAHSYLFTQFFSTKVNKRTDEYGGNFENRIRIVMEIFEGIKQNVNSSFVVGIRMGCNENDLENSIYMAKIFESIGIDYLHVSTGFDNTAIDKELPDDFPCNWIVYGGTIIKENVDIPVIVVNSIKTVEQVRYLIENKLADFVAVGRAQLADHNFVNHIREGKDVIKCLDCKPCRWFIDGRNCPVQNR